jgi:hypothetical protein
MVKNKKNESTPTTKKPQAAARTTKLRKEALAVTQANLARIEADERGESAAPAKPARSAKSTAFERGGISKPSSKATKHIKAKKVSALDAAAQVLAGSKQPMSCSELIDAMAAKRLWSSPGGKTPHATLYAAIAREISIRGNDSRFKKVERGMFAAA